MTTASDVIVELIAAQMRGVQKELEDASDNMLNWQPDLQANSIAVTIWHFSRMADMVYNSVLHGKEPTEQFWFTEGFAEKYDYNPLGKGMNGWGALTGYTVDEMLAIPNIALEDVLGYFNKSYDALKAHIDGMSAEDFDAPVGGAGGDKSTYYWTRIVVIDATRHMGEITAIKNMWQRQHGASS